MTLVVLSPQFPHLRVHLQVNVSIAYISADIQGVPKITQFSGILAITPLWKGLELKVGGVSKTSGNSLCDRHKNFPI